MSYKVDYPNNTLSDWVSQFVRKSIFYNIYYFGLELTGWSRLEHQSSAHGMKRITERKRTQINLDLLDL